MISSLIILLVALVQTQTDPFHRERDLMVRTQIIARGVRDTTTLRAMQTVPRHQFVPADQKRSAYDDSPLPIGYGQTISQPYIVAYMTELLRPSPGKRILEIGTGSGYQAAVLAEITDSIYTIEIIPQLGNAAAQRLKELGYRHASIKIGDGYYGWEEHAPFDAIIVTAAAEFIPPPLISQLKDGGRMVIPVGSPFLVQQLMLVEKRGNQISTRSVMTVRFVPFTRAK
ncbi:MAG: protein-L-isoaspartate(D-aspartate) O-methyltransferase [Ignavibacteria bacterium]|nr:protein-L-isoaspartate(D-aspartate) O-methyltransferase [Ignavibacteria bacterium]